MQNSVYAFFILLLVEQLTNYGYKFPLDFLTLR